MIISVGNLVIGDLINGDFDLIRASFSPVMTILTILKIYYKINYQHRLNLM